MDMAENVIQDFKGDKKFCSSKMKILPNPKLRRDYYNVNDENDKENCKDNINFSCKNNENVVANDFSGADRKKRPF